MTNASRSLLVSTTARGEGMFFPSEREKKKEVKEREREERDFLLRPSTT